jgi:hypothetical protein
MRKTVSKTFRTICVSADEPSAQCELFDTQEDASCHAARALEGRNVGQVVIEKLNDDGLWECLEVHRTAT